MALPPIVVPIVAILAALGFEGGPWWAALAGAALIGAANIAAQRDLRPRPAAVTFVDMLPVSGVPSMLHGCIAAFAAMAAGRVLQWCWATLAAAVQYQDAAADFF
jgi:hypothetical protein